MLTDQEIHTLANGHFTGGNNLTSGQCLRFARAIESAATAPLLAQIAEQLRTIQALNSAINSHGSTTTENLTLVGRLEDRIADLERQLADAAKDDEGSNLHAN